MRPGVQAAARPARLIAFLVTSCEKTTFLRKTSPTSHSCAPPTVPAWIPDTQSPVGSAASTGVKSRSRASIANVCGACQS